MPNESSLQAVQDAIFARLSADATLLGITDPPVAVLGFEPEEPPANFLVIGTPTELAWHTLGGTDQGWGWIATVTVHGYSYYKGDLRALQMLKRVVALLNFQPLVIAGYQTVICEYGAALAKVLIETKDKRERRHLVAPFTVRVKD